MLEFLGTFHLLGEFFFDIGLSQMHRENIEMSFSNLQEIRMKMACWCQPFSKSNSVLHVLEEVIENTNRWKKCCLLATQLNRRNIILQMCANQCKKIEKEECMSNKINYE